MIRFIELITVVTIVSILFYAAYNIWKSIKAYGPDSVLATQKKRTEISVLIEQLKADIKVAETEALNGKQDAEEKLEFYKTQLEQAELVSNQLNNK